VLTARRRATLRAADPALLEAYLALEGRLPQPRESYERVFEELNEALKHTLADLSPEVADTRIPARRTN
jgi:hypothetical protein